MPPLQSRSLDVRQRTRQPHLNHASGQLIGRAVALILKTQEGGRRLFNWPPRLVVRLVPVRLWKSPLSPEEFCLLSWPGDRAARATVRAVSLNIVILKGLDYSSSTYQDAVTEVGGYDVLADLHQRS